MFKKVTNTRTYEMSCEKGFFIIEMVDIEETICNARTGETSNLLCRVHYRDTENSGLTTFLIGTYVHKDVTEEEELMNYYDMIVNTDFFDGSIQGHLRDLELLEEQFVKDMEEM